MAWRMHRTHNHHGTVKCIKKTKEVRPLIRGVTHLSRRAKRRLYCKLQLWLWRRRREKCRFGILGVKKRTGSISSPCLTIKTQKNKRKRTMHHTPNNGNSQIEKSAHLSPVGCDPGGSENTTGKQNSLLKSEMLSGFSSLQFRVVDLDVAAASINTSTPTGTPLSQNTGTVQQLSESTHPLKLCHNVRLQRSTDTNVLGDVKRLKVPKPVPAQRFEVDGTSEHTTVPPAPDQATNRDTVERICCGKMAAAQTDPSLKALVKNTQEFLDDFYKTYGSFIPLQKSNVLTHLKNKFNVSFSARKKHIYSEVARYKTSVLQKKHLASFRVVYKKHTLTLEDLLTLADQNWLNDQIMNMYGELIMESAHHKVYFLNSFFHRQLMTKGYDGVKRWTKKVDLFSKNLLLVPIHLEVHWCLVTADFVRKKICLYDSQGNALLKVARNMLKYLMTEAKEKRQTAFETGWTVSFDEKVPKQTNENDCGVFVLEYSRCLALKKPFQFSQSDIPKIRKRIYKELCECKLHELE